MCSASAEALEQLSSDRSPEPQLQTDGRLVVPRGFFFDPPGEAPAAIGAKKAIGGHKVGLYPRVDSVEYAVLAMKLMLRITEAGLPLGRSLDASKYLGQEHTRTKRLWRAFVV